MPEIKDPKPTRRPVVEPEPATKPFSAQATVKLHKRIASAQQPANLDKSGIIRLSIRLFVKRHYKGNGVWDLSGIEELDLLSANDVMRCDFGLPE